MRLRWVAAGAVGLAVLGSLWLASDPADPSAPTGSASPTEARARQPSIAPAPPPMEAGACDHPYVRAEPGRVLRYRVRFGEREASIDLECVRTVDVEDGVEIEWRATTTETGTAAPRSQATSFRSRCGEDGRAELPLERLAGGEGRGLPSFPIPAILGAGDRLEDTHHGTNLTWTRKIEVARVDAFVETPAGDFQAVELRVTDEMSVASPEPSERTLGSRLYLVSGIGLVKSEGELEGASFSAELVSII